MIDIEKLQKLSALDLSAQGRAKVSKSLEGIIGMMSQIDNLELGALKASASEDTLLAESVKGQDTPIHISMLSSGGGTLAEPLLIDKKSEEAMKSLPIEDGLFLAPKAIKK